MPTAVTVLLYKFDELSESAKERAREWFRGGEAEEFGGFGELTESAETVARLLGITFDTHEITLMGGGRRSEPNIYWALDQQGAGASFTGHYSYAKRAPGAIASEFGGASQKPLLSIARRLQTLQKRYAYQLTCCVTTSGGAVNEYSMAVEAESRQNRREVKPEDELELLECFRCFARWIHQGIADEWEYRMSDESVDESIRANEYTFRENGAGAND